MLGTQRALRPLLLVVDLAVVEVSLRLADVVRRNVSLGMPLSEGTGWLTPLVHVTALVSWVLAFYVVRSHSARRLLSPGAWKHLVLASGLGTLFFVAGLFFTKVYDFSRLLTAYFFGITVVLYLARHLVVQGALAWLTRPFVRRCLLLGGGEVGAEVARRLAATRVGVELVGVIPTGGPLPGFPSLGTPEEVSTLVQRHQIHDVFVALPGEQHALVEDVVHRLQADPVRVHFVPDVLELTLVRARVEDFNGIPVIGLREPPIDGTARTVKRAFDLAAGSMLTLLAAPVMLACAAAVKLTDGGPVLFRQRRVGENGRPFDMLKFRSMVVDAEARLKELGIDLAQLPADNPVFKIQHDPRVTRVGRFLRRWSLDELPQFLNVLKGDMSLVGPRPEEAAVVARYSFFHRKRLAVKPGITGPMQVSGRGDLPLAQRLNLELAYIESWTIWSDLKILAKTIPVVLWGKGAY